MNNNIHMVHFVNYLLFLFGYMCIAFIPLPETGYTFGVTIILSDVTRNISKITGLKSTHNHFASNVISNICTDAAERKDSILNSKEAHLCIDSI